METKPKMEAETRGIQDVENVAENQATGSGRRSVCAALGLATPVRGKGGVQEKAGGGGRGGGQRQPLITGMFAPVNP